MAIFWEQDSNLSGKKWSDIEFQVLNLWRHWNLVDIRGLNQSIYYVKICIYLIII